MADITRDFVHLSRLALDNRPEDVAMLVRRTLSSVLKRRPDLAPDITDILSRLSNVTATRSALDPLPVDSDSRLELLRREYDPRPEVQPVWPKSVESSLSETVLERGLDNELHRIGVQPTRSLLFKGPPGTGKSLAARWLAYRLHYPLLTLDLSAVMSSFLGKTGNNIRVVLDYARRSQCVLLLDEFDAIAKRRDDAAEVGELKRLVTVLLQEIDSWPPHGLLVAATNHPNLLDPAVWRRFDRVVEFVLPTRQEVQVLLTSLLPSSEIAESFVVLLSHILDGVSFADVTKTLSAAKRYALVRRSKLEEALLEVSIAIGIERNPREKLALAAVMKDHGLSQRRISTLIGVSRDTIRSHASGTQLDSSKRSSQRGE